MAGSAGCLWFAVKLFEDPVGLVFVTVFPCFMDHDEHFGGFGIDDPFPAHKKAGGQKLQKVFSQQEGKYK
jgi:hypothetical protein